jgi:hypothetical protein
MEKSQLMNIFAMTHESFARGPCDNSGERARDRVSSIDVKDDLIQSISKSIVLAIKDDTKFIHVIGNQERCT